jgi:hypothetical protein
MPRQLWCLFMTSFSGLFTGSFWQVLKAHNLIVKTSDKGAFRKGQCMYQSLFDKVEVQSGCLWIYRESFAARFSSSYIVEAASSSLARCKPQILRGTTNHRSTPSNLYRSQDSRKDKRRKLKRKSRSSCCKNAALGQNHGFARAIEISRFFRDLILVDASEMNNAVGFIFTSAFKPFLFKLVCFQLSN